MSEVKSEIIYDDFCKLDIRTGQITKSERVPKSEKLLKLEVYFGELGSRQIVAGIGKDYDSDAIVGQMVVAVVNLAPRKLMGLESYGMLLAAQSENGKICLVSCVGAAFGSQVG